MTTLSNPHDRFFKETFSRPEVIRDFLENYLPAPVVALLNLDTLQLRKDSFVDPELQEHFSDLLYQVQLRDGQEMAYVYLLLEHKSYPDPLTVFQLLRYLVRIWEQILRQGEKRLAPVIPLVVYHGREQWQVARDFAGLFSGEEALRPYWPQFRYELCDLSAYSREEIRGAANAQIALLLLRYIFDEELAGRLPEIFALFRELADKETALEYLATVLRYLSVAGGQVTQPDLVQAVEAALGEAGGDIMATLAQQWLEEGIEQGRQQGLEQGRQQGLQQGLERGLREMLLETLRTRFGAVPDSLVARLEKISDTEALKQLQRQALMAESLEMFERHVG